MEKIYARFNHGRWIADCPNCPSATVVKIGDEMVICGACYPDKLAKKWSLLPSGNPIPSSDKSKQDSAKELAYSMSEVYEIVFPDDAKLAEEVLRKRKIEHQHYYPKKESLEDLERENKRHPKLKYLWDVEENKKYLEEIELKVIPEDIEKLSEKVLRRIK